MAGMEQNAFEASGAHKHHEQRLNGNIGSNRTRPRTSGNATVVQIENHAEIQPSPGAVDLGQV